MSDTDTIEMLRTALVKLVGVDGRAELKAKDLVCRQLPEHGAALVVAKVALLDAVYALIRTLPERPTLPSGNVEVSIYISPEWNALLEVLSEDRNVNEVAERLLDHAQQGVYRPGAWERGWLEQAFGDEWQERLMPGDPYGRPGCEHIFVKPKPQP